MLSYQSFYDSLSTEDDPSYAISGGLDGRRNTAGRVGPDRAGAARGRDGRGPRHRGRGSGLRRRAGVRLQHARLAAGGAQLAGHRTDEQHQDRLAGYSGGAIATEWAAQQAPTYAPEINSDLVGAAMGGVLVDPAHNLKYVEGSSKWASIIPMSLDGLSRAFHLDLTPYLTEYGQELLSEDQHVSITNEQEVSGLTWSQLAKPEYATPESIQVFVKTANKLIMGHEGAPTVPLLIGQGNGGEEFEGTAGDKPGIGPGDGVMIAGDVRSLARECCGGGIRALHRIPAPRARRGRGPVAGRNRAVARRTFRRPRAPQDCSEIAAGNSLTPIG